MKPARKRTSSSEIYQSPHHPDGGWHGSAIGSEKFDTLWEPMFDRILVKRITEPSKGLIVMPQTAAPLRDTSNGIVLRVGPGKRIAGEGNRRQPLDVQPGDEVIIGRWTDWESFGDDVVLCQEADIRVVVTHNGVIAGQGMTLPSAEDLDVVAQEKESSHAHTQRSSKKKAVA